MAAALAVCLWAVDFVSYRQDVGGLASVRYSSSIRAVRGGRPATSRTMLRIAGSSRSAESITSMSRMRGEYVCAQSVAPTISAEPRLRSVSGGSSGP